MAAHHADAALTALALVEARLEGRDGDLAYLLDHCGNQRAVTVVLADMAAQILAGEFGEAAGEALAQLRPRLLAGGDGP
jgi:RecB family exonuclease